MRAAEATRIAMRLLGTLLVLDGCTVGPKFTRPEAPIAATWTAHADPRLAAQAPIDAAWWKSLKDPVLDRLVDQAYQQNLPLQIAGLRIAEARAQLGVATGQQWPQIQQLFGSATANGVSQNAATFAPARFFGDFQLGFDAAWELDFWGKYRRGVEAEAATVMASEADYDSGIVSLTAEVARTYVAVRTFEVLIQLTQQNARTQEESLNIAESRFHNGATSELDVAQAQTLLESTRAAIPQLEIGLQQARNALSTLLGQPPGSVEALLAGPTAIPLPPPKVAVSVPAELLRRRPDIRSAELSAAAPCACVGVAESELYPSFTLIGTIGLETTATSHAFPSLFSADSLFYTVGPRVTFPFFNYGRLRNAVRVEDARLQELLVNYRDTVLRAAQEVEDSLVGFLKSQEQLTSEQASVAAAQRAVDLAIVQYREGATDYQRVLDAQRTLLQQQTSAAQASSAVVTNLIGLFKALGGGWELREGQPFVPAKTEAEMKARTNWGDLLAPRAPESPNPPPPAKP